ETGCTLINDPMEISLAGKKVLLMHGDTLCTDDVKYQKWRCFITHPFIKGIYSIMPYALRKKIARNVRSYVADAVQKKPAEIIDVTEQAVIETIKKFNVETLIHGHTHRQAMHDINTEGVNAKRIVLGDWYEDDCVLIHDNKGYRFERIESYINTH
ncbi:MAG: UDP-2,3-diacylglucosamine diphosphatase, partial [Gammaproteobacteria bacterium]